MHTRRAVGDGDSYISKGSSWMKEPVEIGDGWFFEGCTSLPQKRDVLGTLSKIGYSTPFVECCEEFVAGKSVRTFLPTKEEAQRMLAEPPGMEPFEVPPEISEFSLQPSRGKRRRIDFWIQRRGHALDQSASILPAPSPAVWRSSPPAAAPHPWPAASPPSADRARPRNRNSRAARPRAVADDEAGVVVLLDGSKATGDSVVLPGTMPALMFRLSRHSLRF